MAIIKKIELENGVTVNYHRIVNIQKITNQQTIIEIASYTSEEKRKEEIKALSESKRTGEAIPMNVYIETDMILKDYDASETIEDIYSYLKTLEKYKNAEDV